jgi:hypothetical protein
MWIGIIVVGVIELAQMEKPAVKALAQPLAVCE